MNGAPEHQSLIGQVVLGRYRVVRLLAVGGMGVIYLARGEGSAGFVRPVTVKRILPARGSAESIVKGFAREARILSNLRHPGIVGIIDFREEDGAYLMVLDYVHGFDLGKWYRFVQAARRRFPVTLSVHVILAMLDALHYAHTLAGPEGQPLNIVHRDVSPSNLLVGIEGHLKLTDFGIARMQASSEEWRTEEGKIRGKFHYVAPELFSRAEPTAGSDVFSAGVVLHELLAGLNEFRADDFRTTVGRVLGHQLSPLDRVRPDVSPDLAAVVAKATAKKPEERFTTALEFAEALRAVRKETAEEVVAELQAAVAEDFLDARFPASFGAEPLKVLEQAWKNPPAGPSPEAAKVERAAVAGTSLEAATDVAPMPVTPSDGQNLNAAPPDRTAALEVRPLATTAAPPRVRPAFWVAGLLALLAFLAAGYWARSVSTPRFVLVEEGAVVTDREMAVEAPAEAAAKPLNPAATATPARTAGSAVPALRPRVAPEQALSLAFARQGRSVERCFLEHATASERAQQIAVRFRVDVEGRVERAELIPAALEPSALGRCLLAVAQKTRFDPQAKPMTFRIPVTVKRGN